MRSYFNEDNIINCFSDSSGNLYEVKVQSRWFNPQKKNYLEPDIFRKLTEVIFHLHQRVTIIPARKQMR